MENMTKSAKIVDMKHYFSAFMDANISFYYSVCKPAPIYGRLPCKKQGGV